MTLFLFIIQVLTGILLLLYYRPTPNDAFESVQYMMTQVRFGWLIRSVHSWSANLMIFTAFVHMFSVYFLKAYRKAARTHLGQWHAAALHRHGVWLQRLSASLEHPGLLCHQGGNGNGRFGSRSSESGFWFSCAAARK